MCIQIKVFIKFPWIVFVNLYYPLSSLISIGGNPSSFFFFVCYRRIGFDQISFTAHIYTTPYQYIKPLTSIRVSIHHFIHNNEFFNYDLELYCRLDFFLLGYVLLLEHIQTLIKTKSIHHNLTHVTSLTYRYETINVMDDFWNLTGPILQLVKYFFFCWGVIS